MKLKAALNILGSILTPDSDRKEISKEEKKGSCPFGYDKDGTKNEQ